MNASEVAMLCRRSIYVPRTIILSYVGKLRSLAGFEKTNLRMMWDWSPPISCSRAPRRRKRQRRLCHIDAELPAGCRPLVRGRVLDRTPAFRGDAFSFDAPGD